MGLSVRYGPLTALDGIDLRVDRGEVVAVVGPNGAGKSTLLRAISGLEKAQAGEARVNGVSVRGVSPHRIARAGVAHVPEGRGILAHISVRENLQLGGRGLDKRQFQVQLDRVLDIFEALRTRLGDQAGTLSGGQQQMLALARGLISEPALLMVDEPSMGLAPVVVEELIDVIRSVPRTGAAVLVTEENAELGLELSQRCYVMARGAVTREGTSVEMGAEVFESYIA